MRRPHGAPIVRKGQVWERKKDGIRNVIVARKKDDSWCMVHRGITKQVSHRTTEFDLYKYWRLVPKEELDREDLAKAKGVPVHLLEAYV